MSVLAISNLTGYDRNYLAEPTVVPVLTRFSWRQIKALVNRMMFTRLPSYAENPFTF